jgi:hypothetical protein
MHGDSLERSVSVRGSMGLRVLRKGIGNEFDVEFSPRVRCGPEIAFDRRNKSKLYLSLAFEGLDGCGIAENLRFGI